MLCFLLCAGAFFVFLDDYLYPLIFIHVVFVGEYENLLVYVDLSSGNRGLSADAG